jgi:hypothetical protein
VGGAADKEADTVRIINIISQLQYFVARRFAWYKRLFSFHPQASDVGETHSLVPTTVKVN